MTYKDTLLEAFDYAKQLAFENNRIIYIGKKFINGETKFAVTFNMPSSRQWVKEALEFVRFVKVASDGTIIEAR